MFGLLNLNKPSGCTSRDVVNRVAKLVGRSVKVGHAGTLDPLAEGVLLVCVGPATRLEPSLHEFSKTYRGVFELGRTSSTEDITGDVENVDLPATLGPADIQNVLPDFLGTISQVPPAYSAAKVSGERAYALARRGERVTLAAREVQIHRTELLASDWPRVTLEVDCATGVYIRTLGRDIARALGTDAVMCSLMRTRIGPFELAAALDAMQLTRETLPNALLDPLLAVPNLPRVAIDDSQRPALRQGRQLPCPPDLPPGKVAVVTVAGTFLALGEARNGVLAPTMVFDKGDLP